MTVSVLEVGPRDGLQNEANVLAAGVRAALVNRLADAGLARIEAVSFVRADRVPAMAGAEEVVAGLEQRAGVTYAGLVLNERGYERLSATSLGEAHFAFAVSETFNERNSNAPVSRSIDVAKRIVERAHREGRSATVTLATAFGCPFEGKVESRQVLEIAEQLAPAKPDEIVLADTIGVAVPCMVRALVEQIAVIAPVGVHLHNTRNTGLANAYAAIEAGAGSLDASVGGIGGCPFAPRATGNICTEDLIYMLHGEGIETGVDLDELITVAQWLEAVLGHDLPGLVHRAGTFAPVAG